MTGDRSEFRPPSAVFRPSAWNTVPIISYLESVRGRWAAGPEVNAMAMLAGVVGAIVVLIIGWWLVAKFLINQTRH